MGFCLYNNAALAARAAQQYVEKKQHLDRLRFEQQQQQKKKKQEQEEKDLSQSQSTSGSSSSSSSSSKPPPASPSRGGALFGQGQGKLRSRPSFRVMILDWDVHHGNGTQAMFEDDPTVS